MSRDCRDNLDITNRIKRAGNAFGAIRKSIFFNSTVSSKVKASVYESLILPIVLWIRIMVSYRKSIESPSPLPSLLCSSNV